MRPTVLLLGSPHLANPGQDYVNITIDDMLAPDRQRQIAECLDRLTRFRPTKVTIEIAATSDAEINDEYHRYRSGTFTLTASEHHQIGFRLAAMCGHDRIYPVDWNEGAVGGDDAVEFAREHQPDIYASLMASIETFAATGAAAIAERSLRDLLIDLNDPATLRRNHRVYLDLARIGASTNYVGTDYVKGWYERNLIIYANISRLIAHDDERILVVYGSGHIPLLTQFLHDSDHVDLAPAATFLR